MREWISETAFYIYEFIAPLLGISFVAIFLVFIPLGLFAKTRGFSAVSLFIISFIFGIATWIYSAGIAFALLGWFWLIVGLLLAGLGVVLVAFIGAILQGYFGIAFGIASLVFTVIVTRSLANYLGEKDEANKRAVL